MEAAEWSCILHKLARACVGGGGGERGWQERDRVKCVKLNCC